VLKWRGLKLPTTYLVDPGSTRRVIWLVGKILPLLRRRARILAEKEPRAPFDASLYDIDRADGPLAAHG